MQPVPLYNLRNITRNRSGHSSKSHGAHVPFSVFFYHILKCLTIVKFVGTPVLRNKFFLIAIEVKGYKVTAFLFYFNLQPKNL